MLLIVVEPRESDAMALKRAFGKHFSVVLTDCAAEALLSAGEFRPDVVVCAAQLPDISSAQLVSTLNRHHSRSIVIGAGPDDGQLAADAIRAGATACVARPYRIPELAPLLASLCPPQVGLPALERGPIRLDPHAQHVVVHGRSIELPLQECRLLHLLMSQSDQVVTREEIRHQIWPGLPDERSNTITVHIRRLRMRLGDHGWHPAIITTVRGKGYRFTAPPPLHPV